MENNLIKMKKLDLITEFTGSWGRDAESFLEPFFKDNEIISLSDKLFLSRGLLPGSFVFMIKREFFEKIGSDFVSIENLFQFLIPKNVEGMEKKLKKVLNERLENGNLYTEINKDELISLNEIKGAVFEKLTLIDWLSKNFLLSKLISRTIFALSIFILLLIIVYLQIVTNGPILEIKNLIASFFFIVLVLFSSLAIKEVLNFKEDNKKSFLTIQKKLLESTNCDKNDLKNELFEAILLESKKLNEHNALINFGEYRIDLLHHYLYNETIVESINLLRSPFYHFQKLL